MKGADNALEAIKRLALQHGEKAGLLLVLLLVAVLLYAAVRQERLPNQYRAEQLQQLTSQVRRTMQDYSWQQAVSEAPDQLRVYRSLARAGGATVDPQPYVASGAGWDPAVVPPAALRSDPKLLPAYDLAGHGLTRLFAFNDPERIEQLRREELANELRREKERRRRSGEEEKESAQEDSEAEDGRRQVDISRRSGGVQLSEEQRVQVMSTAVVLAKVPLPEQVQAYREALQNARSYDPTKDFPQYLGYYIERAEVRSRGELQWQAVALRNGEGGRPLPVVAEMTIAKAIADWPVMEEEPIHPDYVHPVLTFPLPPLVGRDWGELARLPSVPLESDRDQRGKQGEIEEQLPENLEENPTSLFGGEGNRGRGRSTSRSGGTTRRSRSRNEPSAALVDAPFLLLRFFDFSVQPGKQYKYRVKLILEDVNYGQPVTALEPEVVARERKRIIAGEWSEPSVTLSIPQAGLVRVAAAEAPNPSRFQTEPTAQIVLESFGIDDQGGAYQASVVVPAQRGSVLNYQGDLERLVDGGRYLEEVEDSTVKTDILVLDLAGGERLTDDLQAPAQALLMESSGRIYLQSELEDEQEVATRRAIFAPPERRR